MEINSLVLLNALFLISATTATSLPYANSAHHEAALELRNIKRGFANVPSFLSMREKRRARLSESPSTGRQNSVIRPSVRAPIRPPFHGGVGGTPFPYNTSRLSNNSACFPYGSRPVRGVNVGGWLVLECWMTPSLCASANDSRVVDEWTFGQYVGRLKATQLLEQHWASWITEQDFANIARAGLNHVRLPFGYWGLDISQGEPYIQGSYAWLIKGVKWAQRHRLTVLIDLHGAPGSQNGYDNSGKRGTAHWSQSQQNLDRTTAILTKLAQEFAKPEYQNVVAGIDLLNEPAIWNGVDPAVLKSWYPVGYQAVRYPGSQTPDTLAVSISDASMGWDAWTGFMQPPQFTNVLMDSHIYVAFDKTLSNANDTQLTQYFCTIPAGLTKANQNLPTFIGEFSPARTDCAAFSTYAAQSQYASSYGNDSCIGKTMALGPLTVETKIGLKHMFDLQTSIYETYGIGWMMWAWKQEKGQEWSYSGGIQGGWIPSHFPSKVNSNPCA